MKLIENSEYKAVDVHLYRCTNCYAVIALELDKNRPKDCSCGRRDRIRIHVV